MMIELQRPFCVETPIGYGWAIIYSRESALANDIWTVAMERDGAICHFRSDQISALPNGTLDIRTNTPNTPCKSNTTIPTAEQRSGGKRKAKTRQRGAGR